ncbi:MAG: aminotransferase class III-fold pyridoxal phosphate-dependent enzyme [Desulfobacterales bacterium]
MEPYRQTQSQSLYERAKKVIPGCPFCPDGGIYGHYSTSVWARGNPVYFSRSEGSRFWDVDGNSYIDYMCAYGPMILGYNHPVVDAAALDQYKKGNTVSLASPVMIELAELLVDMVSIADWAFFSKNGADPTNLSVMTARASTGRKIIVAVEGGYHGTTPWMQDPGSGGTLTEDTAHVIRIPWNDYERFESVVGEHGDDIAGFISTPYHHPVIFDNEMPAEGYWRKVETLCRKKGIVLILDDVRAGFRADLGGSNEYFGFKPDLICFGKAMGNGYPISALVGTDALRDAVTSVFFTGTQFFNAAPMAASVAALKELKKIDGPKLMLETGKKLAAGLIDAARSHGLDLKVSGLPSMPYFRITNQDPPVFTEGLEALHKGLHADWISECVQRGIYMVDYHNHFISTAHTDEDLQKTFDIADIAFGEVEKVYGEYVGS